MSAFFKAISIGRKGDWWHANLLEDENGNLLVTKNTMREGCREYFNELLNGKKGRSEQATIFQAAKPFVEQVYFEET